MPAYSATIQLSNGTLTVTRPHPSVEAVDDVVDALVYNVRDEDNPVTSVGVTIVTDDSNGAVTPEPPAVETSDPSDTPIGDDAAAARG